MLRILLYFIFRILEFAILAYCLMSWLVTPGSRAYDIYTKMGYYLEPMFRPARKLLSRFNFNIPVDLAPWLTMIFISLIYRVLAVLL